MSINLYDINKQLIANNKPYDSIQLHNKIKEIYQDFWEIHSPYEYVMLLCRDIYDMTVFHVPHATNSPIEELKETLTIRGDVLLIEKQDNGSYEIWIKLASDQQIYCYYLFDCKDMIVECQ